MPMRNTAARSLRVGLAVLVAVWGYGSIEGRAQPGVAHRTGQGIVPIYDGYELNDDGTVTLWFGYINRNYEETVDLPIGPANAFAGPRADRGQPTHFRPRRQKAVFSVTVPEAEARSVKWTLTTREQPATAVATILPSSVISRRRGTLNSDVGVPPNTPPVVKAALDSSTIAVSEGATVRLTATDDGQPLRNGAGAKLKAGLTMTWVKYRGPGDVTFEPQRDRLPDSGVVTTKVTFTQPGEYELLATVDDGSMNFGEYCCWTNALVKVTARAQP